MLLLLSMCSCADSRSGVLRGISASFSTSQPRVFASPLAKKIVREAGQDISNIFAAHVVAGHRLVAADALAALSRLADAPRTPAPVSAAAAVAAAEVMSSSGGAEEESLAELLAAAKKSVPHFHLSVDVNLRDLLALRERLNRKAAVQLGALDFFVKAAALTMQAVPEVNSSWRDSCVRRFAAVDINLVSGSAAPLLADVASKGLSTIAREIASGGDGDAVLRAGTFSVHDLGKYGIKAAAPIIWSPQACALALGSISESVIPADANTSSSTSQAWQVVPTVTATLACDHRVVDGAVAAQWLAGFKHLLEHPEEMLL